MEAPPPNIGPTTTSSASASDRFAKGELRSQGSASTTLYSVVVQQPYDRALLFHDSIDDDAPRAVFGKLIVSDRFVML